MIYSVTNHCHQYNAVKPGLRLVRVYRTDKEVARLTDCSPIVCCHAKSFTMCLVPTAPLVSRRVCNEAHCIRQLNTAPKSISNKNSIAYKYTTRALF